jgi:outer membrane protein, multidrug efflux system
VIRQTAFLFFCLLLCSSCALFPLPERELELPERYRQTGGGEQSASAWWTAFGDEQLNRLMEKTLAGNLSIEQAAARLRQAEAEAVRSGAARFPSLTGNAEAATQYRDNKGQSTVTTDDYSVGLAARYELDLWGRVASGHRAARRTRDARRFDLQTAAMTVSAETALTYFSWQQLSARRELLAGQLESRRKMLSVIERRFQTAQADALDVLLQRAQVAAAEAVLPPVDEALQSAAHALAVLTGRPPQTDLNLKPRPLPRLSAPPAAGLPADLLSVRPDLQAAWARLEAADWNVRAAQADRLPALTLTGSAVTRSENTDNLFDNWIGNLAAGLSAPLIDGGGRRAEVRRIRAVADETFAAYRQTVFDALTEVEDALAAETYRRETLAAVVRRRELAASAAEEAYRRYTRGLESYFDALNAEISRQSLEESELQSTYNLLAARVQLHRALGGDWAVILETFNGESDE